MVRSLDDVVTAVAAELMAATAGNHVATSQRVLADLVDHFGVDYGFLRHNDHTVRATLLIAEWPPRETVPDPDPIGVVYFADADSVFALIEHRKEPYVLRPEPSNADYQRYIEDGTGVPQTSLAAIPLLSGDLTTGTLGFVKYGDRDWLPEELNALQAIATLLAQLQARIVAEEQLRYLAEHDDLTGLLNRRMVITNLDNRLVEGQPGPVALFFLDLDRLKVISDYLGYDAGDRFLRAFADLLREAVDAEALIARFGGDEFVVVPGSTRCRPRTRPGRANRGASCGGIRSGLTGATSKTDCDRRRGAHPPCQYWCRRRRTGARQQFGCTAPGQSGHTVRQELGRKCGFSVHFGNVGKLRNPQRH